jgi:hypothetical protein
MRGETEPAQLTHLLGLRHALQMPKTPAAGTKASISPTPTPVVDQSALKKPLGAAADVAGKIALDKIAFF